jgi:hypothetical protein
VPFDSWAAFLDFKRDDFAAVPEFMLRMAPTVALLTDGLSLTMTIYLALRRAYGDAVSEVRPRRARARVPARRH